MANTESAASSDSAEEPVTVTVVTSPACHFCDDAQAALAKLAETHPLTVRPVAADSPAGRALLSRQGNGMFPLVLVDGAFFSTGRLPRRKLARLLERRATVREGAR